MPLTATNGTFGANATGTTVTTTAKNTTSGSGFVLIAVYPSTRSVVSITDNKGNSAPTQIGTELDGSVAALKATVFYYPNLIGGAGHTFTLTINASDNKALSGVEITTTGGAGIALDKSSLAVDTASPFTPGSTGTLAQAIEMAIAGLASDSASNPATFAESTGFSTVANAASLDGSQFWTTGLASLVTAATTALAPSMTQSGAALGAAFVATFTENGGGGGPSNAPRAMNQYRQRRAA